MRTNNRLRVAVYAIAKDEAKHVHRFMEGVHDADEIVVADTGSSDDTVALLRDTGAHVHQIKVDPFRFDVARNLSLDLVPEDVDVCFALDLDEVPDAGWREALEQSWRPDTTRMWHPFIFNRNADGSPGVYYYANRLHGRHGYNWVCPAHEVLVPREGFEEVYVTCDRLRVEHLPDQTKSRGMYLPLLELGVKEAPGDSRLRFHLVREYFFYQQWDNLIREVDAFLELPVDHWHRQRSAAMRMVARAWRARGEPDTARQWLYRAIAEAPQAREAYLDLAELQLAANDFHGTYYFAHQALAIEVRDMSYVTEADAWGWRPHDLIGVAAYYLGNKEEALHHAQLAVEMNPGDPRLQKNVELIAAHAGPATA